MVMLGGVAGAALAGWFLLPAALLRPLINEEGWNAAARMAQMALFSGAEAGPVAASWAMLYLSWALGLGLALAGMARPGGGAACARCASPTATGAWAGDDAPERLIRVRVPAGGGAKRSNSGSGAGCRRAAAGRPRDVGGPRRRPP
jgi:hypothetical protein